MRTNIFLSTLFLLMQACAPAFGATDLAVRGHYAPGLIAYKNFVKNPNCEKNTLNITSSTGSFTQQTAAPLVAGAGAKCRWNPGATGTLKFAISSLSPNIAAGNCRASFFTDTTTPGEYIAYLMYDSVKVTSNLAVNASVTGQEFAIDYPCSSTATTRELVIESTTAPSFLYIGGVNFGKNLNIGTASQAKLLGKIRMSGCSDWTRSNGAWGSMSATTSCTYTTEGNAQAPATMLPAIKLSNVPPGSIQIVARGHFGKTVTSTNAGAAFRFNDGTNTFSEQIATDIASASGQTAGVGQISGSYTYATAQSNLTIDIQSKISTTGAGTAALISGSDSNSYSAGAINGLEIEVFWYPSIADQVMSLSSQPSFTDWSSTQYVPLIKNPGGVAITIGNGSLSTSARREGDSLHMHAKLNIGSTSNLNTNVACLNPPTGLTFDTAKKPTETVYNNHWTYYDASANKSFSGNLYDWGAVNGICPELTALDAGGGIGLPVTPATGDYIELEATMPIVGWTSNVHMPLVTQSVVARDNTGGVTTVNTITSKSANYTATDQDETIVFTASATLSLPAAASYKGKKYEVLSSGSSTLATIDPNASETVCGQTTIKLDGTDSVAIQSDGTNWVGLQGSCRKTRSATIVVDSTPTTGDVTQTGENWISALSRTAAGDENADFQSGLFSATPDCHASVLRALGNTRYNMSAWFITVATSGVRFNWAYNDDQGASTAAAVTVTDDSSTVILTCTGPR